MGAETVALYTMHSVLHLPSRGQFWGCLQLHVEVGGAGLGAKTLVLWALMIAPIFGMQL